MISTELRFLILGSLPNSVALPEGAVGGGGSNCGGCQHCVVKVEKEGDDALPPSLSAPGRWGGGGGEGCNGGWITQDNLQ